MKTQKRYTTLWKGRNIRKINAPTLFGEYINTIKTNFYYKCFDPFKHLSNYKFTTRHREAFN